MLYVAENYVSPENLSRVGKGGISKTRRAIENFSRSESGMLREPYFSRSDKYATYKTRCL